MSRTEIELVVFQCDHEDEDGNRCDRTGDRESIRICCVCGKDLCKSHSDLTTVTTRRLPGKSLVVGQYRYVYPFCIEHMDELKKLILEKFGDDYEIPSTTYGGTASATGTPHNVY